MAFDDLCTIQDIRAEYPDLATTHNSSINKKIPGATIEVYADAGLTETPTDETSLYNLKMACIYFILSWLEENGMVDSGSGEISSMGDGDFSVTFNQVRVESKGGIAKGYDEKYLKYIRKLKPLPPVGSTRCY